MTSISSFIAKLLSARHIVMQCEINFPLEFVCACVCVCVCGGGGVGYLHTVTLVTQLMLWPQPRAGLLIVWSSSVLESSLLASSLQLEDKHSRYDQKLARNRE